MTKLNAEEGGRYSTECQGADGHEGRPHTRPLRVLMWFGLTCCERPGGVGSGSREGRQQL